MTTKSFKQRLQALENLERRNDQHQAVTDGDMRAYLRSGALVLSGHPWLFTCAHDLPQPQREIVWPYASYWHHRLRALAADNVIRIPVTVDEFITLFDAIYEVHNDQEL